MKARSTSVTVMIPTSLSPSITGRPPIFFSSMIKAAFSRGSSAPTVTTGLAITSSTVSLERR